MKSIIVGTAGHIDHGKTALVKALTGIDADRLPGRRVVVRFDLSDRPRERFWMLLERPQAELCIKYCDTDAQKARALEVAEQACMLRWASVTDLYRRDYLGEKDILPPGVNG